MAADVGGGLKPSNPLNHMSENAPALQSKVDFGVQSNALANI